MKSKEIPPNGEILIYQAADGSTKLNVRLVDETLWLSQENMANLFDCTVENVRYWRNMIIDNFKYIGNMKKLKTQIDYSENGSIFEFWRII